MEVGYARAVNMVPSALGEVTKSLAWTSNVVPSILVVLECPTALSEGE